jgi:hypothetical protein
MYALMPSTGWQRPARAGCGAPVGAVAARLPCGARFAGLAPNFLRYAPVEQAARSQRSKCAARTPRKPPLLGAPKVRAPASPGGPLGRPCVGAEGVPELLPRGVGVTRARPMRPARVNPHCLRWATETYIPLSPRLPPSDGRFSPTGLSAATMHVLRSSSPGRRTNAIR